MMRCATAFQRVLTVALSVGAATLLLTSGLSHRHDAATTSDSAHPCRICQIQTGFSATPTVAASVHTPRVLVTIHAPHQHEAPRAVRLTRRAAPRAPPSPS